MTPTTIRAQLAGRVDLDLTLEPGRVHALVGPNGAGKSTTVGLLAGLWRPTSGSVVLAGREVAGPRTWVPMHRRGVTLLGQRPALFDHLSVRENVAFGPRASGATRRAARQRADEELSLVAASALADRRPSELSGGEAQRVALARALACDPVWVLLDEPLAALDVEVAAAVRPVLAERLAGRSVLLVTHDLTDVLAIADDIVALRAGRVAQQGAVADVLAQPSTDFLAKLAAQRG